MNCKIVTKRRSIASELGVLEIWAGWDGLFARSGDIEETEFCGATGVALMSDGSI